MPADNTYAKFPKALSQRCAELPGVSSLEDNIEMPLVASSRSAEVRYAKEYADAVHTASPPDEDLKLALRVWTLL